MFDSYIPADLFEEERMARAELDSACNDTAREEIIHYYREYRGIDLEEGMVK